MKRLLHLFCLLLVAALLPAAWLISRSLPADPHPYVEKKYAGWSGVLRAWVCADWSCSGSFLSWLNACAADFERRHEGVYLEFTLVSADALAELGRDGVRPPEMILFSPGVLGDASKLAPVETPTGLRAELRELGDGRAYPVAMGGYVWVYNRELAGGAPAPGDAFAAPPDDGAHRFSAAAVALLSDLPGEENPLDPAPDPGLDLGLPAGAGAPGDGVEIQSEDALERFMEGELPTIVVSQAELARLARLRDAGRGPDWACAAAGQVAFSDQLLLFGVTAQSGDGAAERATLSAAFGASLLTPDAQARLADIGAFSVSGARIYPSHSVYATLDGLLNGRELLVPSDPGSGAPACEALMRELAAGRVDPAQALARLRALLGAPACQTDTPYK